MVNVGRNALVGGGGGHKIRHNHYTPAKKSCFIAQQKKTQRIFRFRTRYPVQYFDFWNILQILNVEKINAGNFVPCAPRKLFSYCKFQREKLPCYVGRGSHSLEAAESGRGGGKIGLRGRKEDDLLRFRFRFLPPRVNFRCLPPFPSRVKQREKKMLK